ncbi:unnamed protein product [Medioppia subpectinata]|uniref:Uncharacterized protein n=1 Tax=Medioppia subpectinata TaxID=1979941 RepID=A0A7R9Q487_9ACAR|nr:unnamed protein product [Medioppia subpectinata]CAG2112375.1 unnamed protein product [Medioppia subpectinata]
MVGVAAGASDTANNAWILEMWDEKVGPYLLAMHFCFGTGMVIAPQIARPFLMGDASSVVMAYVICASIIIISGIVVTFVIFSGKYRTTETQPIEDTAPNAAQVPSITEELIRESERRELKPVYGVMIAILGCLMLATYTSMEMTYFSYESVFAQLSSYKMSEADATVLNTVTLAVYTITRGVDVLLLVKVSAYIILLYHFIIIITFNLVAIFTSNLPSSWLWIYNLGIGIGCGSVTPTIYTVLSQNFTIDDKKTAILLFVGGGMGALYPYIVTTNIMAYPLIFIYISVTTIAVCIVFLFAIKFIAWKFGRIIRPQMVVTAADLTAKELATELSSLDI